MNRFKNFIQDKIQCKGWGLLVLRVLPSYYMLVDHGWGKIINPNKWEKLGDAFSKYFFGVLDFANPLFGFIAAFGESICAVLVLVGLFTQPAALITAITMFFAAMNHITTTGSPEKAWIYFSIYLAIAIMGPGKYSVDTKVRSASGDE